MYGRKEMHQICQETDWKEYDQTYENVTQKYRPHVIATRV